MLFMLFTVYGIILLFLIIYCFLYLDHLYFILNVISMFTENCKFFYFKLKILISDKLKLVFNLDGDSF